MKQMDAQKKNQLNDFATKKCVENEEDCDILDSICGPNKIMCPDLFCTTKLKELYDAYGGLYFRRKRSNVHGGTRYVCEVF